MGRFEKYKAFVRMGGKHVIGVVAELKREAEGQYILPMCTIFGLEEDERGWLVQNQAKLKLENKLTDKDDDHEGIEVATSAFKRKINQPLHVLEMREQRLFG